MKIYNTLTKSKEEFKTIEENKVKIYVCGPTVYDYIHIGNARPYVVFDSVRRYLEYKNYDVNYVQNFTDIDDKIIKKANEENVDMNTISERYIKAAFEDAEMLNIRKATSHPKVTEEIPEIIQMITTLINKGFAYEKNGSVYFSTKDFEKYGELSKKNIEDLESGVRVEIDEEKNNPVDFILWKPKKEGEPFWESPWGDGRPGWHIECSVMAKKYLGETIDIHAGGEDLIFPHHENEIAQSEAANGKAFSKYWMHNGFINIENQKMSKSKGNFFTVRDILKQFSGDVIRYFILSHHYRSPINFSEELMISAQTSLERIKTCETNLKFIIKNSSTKDISEDEQKLLLDAKKFIKDFEYAMDDDFNTSFALASIFDLVRFSNSNTNEKSSIEFAEGLLDILRQLCDILAIAQNTEIETNDDEIDNLIEQRNEARKNKDFKLADEIRSKLTEMDIILEDTPLGVKWSHANKK